MPKVPVKNLNRILRLSVELDEIDNLFSYLGQEIAKYKKYLYDVLNTSLEDINYAQFMLSVLIPQYQKTYKEWKRLRKELYEEN